nr:Hpt domain-containing protein [Pseudomonadota bacterium]
LLRSAHKLKSGSSSIGALRLAALTRQLEALGQSGAAAGAEAQVAQARQAAEDTAAALRALL